MARGTGKGMEVGLKRVGKGGKGGGGGEGEENSIN